MDTSTSLGTATVGGVFDVEQWFLACLANETTIHLAAIRLLHLLSYNDVYNVYGQASDVFRQRYASTVGSLFDMQHFFDDVLAGLPPHSRAPHQSSYYATVYSTRRIRYASAAPESSGLSGDPMRPCAFITAPTTRRFLRRRARVRRPLRSRGADVTVRRFRASTTLTVGSRRCPARRFVPLARMRRRR